LQKSETSACRLLGEVLTYGRDKREADTSLRGRCRNSWR
jgi:hypothetical protein